MNPPSEPEAETPRRNLLRDLAHTSRLPNLPTVWSNVITGYLVGLHFSAAQAPGVARLLPAFSWLHLILVTAAATFLYLCGTFLNDGVDVEWDRRHRPERPAPSGRIPAEVLVNLALVFGIIGVGLTVFLGKFCIILAGAIVAAILLYTAIHKKTAWSVLPMGICRALLFPMAALVGHRFLGGEINQLLWIALAAGGSMLCYIAAVTWLARNESAQGPPSAGVGYWTKVLLFTLPLIAPLIALPLLAQPAGFWTLTPALVIASFGALWISFAMERGKQRGTGAFVSSALAGIPLIDAVFMPNVNLWLPAIPLALFCLSLGLQKITSAT